MFRTYLLLIMQVCAGVVVLVITQQLKLQPAVNAGVIFAIFTLLNLAYGCLFQLQSHLRSYWSVRKLPYLLLGVVAGLLLIAIPVLVALSTGATTTNRVAIGGFSLQAAIVTFIITGWEELWFRSLLLNYCNAWLSKVNICITMGLLFMVIHLLNPEIHLAEQGPVLFLAGTLLTALYFYCRNIWLPAGLHFGNNYFGSLIHTDIQSDRVLGSEGLIYVGLLAVALVVVLVQLRREDRRVAQLSA